MPAIVKRNDETKQRNSNFEIILGEDDDDDVCIFHFLDSWLVK